MPLSSYVWDVNNPNTPEFEMAPASQICCSKFNLKDPNLDEHTQCQLQQGRSGLHSKGAIEVSLTPPSLVMLLFSHPWYLCWVSKDQPQADQLGSTHT
eukprot:661787-Pelagomonas_calceolata.AAC.1